MAQKDDAGGAGSAPGQFGAGPGEGRGGDAVPQSAEERIAALEAELAAAREEAAQANDRWVRERADLENVKRRAARERSELARYGAESLLRELLPVADNLERALQAAQSVGNGAPLVEGVSLVLKGFHDVLERHGVSRVEAAGTQFDPAVHEAMAQVESPHHPPNTVVDEHQRGYRLHERLLRPALVTVAKGTSSSTKVVNDEGGD